MLKFCTLHCIAKVFQFTKNEKFCNAKTKLLNERTAFLRFSKTGVTEHFYILLIVSICYSKIMQEQKLGVTVHFFQQHKQICYFLVNFVRVCRHSNELCYQN